MRARVWAHLKTPVPTYASRAADIEALARTLRRGPGKRTRVMTYPNARRTVTRACPRGPPSWCSARRHRRRRRRCRPVGAPRGAELTARKPPRAEARATIRKPPPSSCASCGGADGGCGRGSRLRVLRARGAGVGGARASCQGLFDVQLGRGLARSSPSSSSACSRRAAAAARIRIATTPNEKRASTRPTTRTSPSPERHGTFPMTRRRATGWASPGRRVTCVVLRRQPDVYKF